MGRTLALFTSLHCAGRKETFVWVIGAVIIVKRLREGGDLSVQAWSDVITAGYGG